MNENINLEKTPDFFLEYNAVNYSIALDQEYSKDTIYKYFNNETDFEIGHLHVYRQFTNRNPQRVILQRYHLERCLVIIVENKI